MDKTKIVKRNKARGKRFEKEIEKRYGFKRIGIFGAEDNFDTVFSIEDKTRKNLAFIKWYEQAKANAKGRIPIVFVKKYQSRDIFVILKADDFFELLGKEVNK